MFRFEEIICPGCNKRLEENNNGCLYCGYEINSCLYDDRPYYIPTLLWLKNNKIPLNNVSPDFIKRLLDAIG